MQIHELNDYSGSLNSGAYLAIDNGNDTGKLSAESLLAGVNGAIDQLNDDLNARIDNIIAGGDAPSAAEVTDARQGFNGTVYPSLGDAIRGQAQKLNNDIVKLENDAFIMPNPLFFNNVSNNGVSVSFDENGYIVIGGTASASGRVQTDLKVYLTPGVYYLLTEKVSGTAKPAFYITDPDGNNVLTLPGSSQSYSILSFTVATAGYYGAFFYATSGESYNFIMKGMLSQHEPKKFVKPGFESDFKGGFTDLAETLAKRSRNMIVPNAIGSWYGLTIEYSDGVYSITGTKANIYTRISLGTITAKTTGDHVLSFVDRNGNGKPALYVCEGSTVVGTWGAAYSTLVVSLTAGTTYTLEAYIAPATTVNHLISVQCEEGNEPTYFNKYGYIPKDCDLSALRLSICGVSIDTYAGWIPGGNSTYYSQYNLASVNMTWWKKLMDRTGLQLLVNNSWNGACASTVNGLASSGVKRCIELDDGVNNPDIVIIGMFGANDWANTTVGEYKFSTALPSKDTDLSDPDTYNTYKDTIEKYSGAMATIFKRIHEKYPNARVYALDMYNYYRGDDLDPAGWSDTHNVPLFNKALYDVAEWFGVTVIKGSECGINGINSRDYCVDGGTGTALHPNDKGHTLIYKKVLSALSYDFGINA